MPPTTTATRTRWIEPELIKALSLYRQIPFGRMHRSAPEVIALSNQLGRTPSSVAMKLSNFASLDPELTARGIAGLKGASKLDRQVWQQYANDWTALAAALDLPEPAFTETPSGAPDSATSPAANTESDRLTTVRGRCGQSFFRRTVLSAYDQRCCITGLASPPLLRASHIVPWAAREDTRLDPHNGLCLNALHDAAFDRGLMTLDEHHRVVYAKSLWHADHSDEGAAMLEAFEGTPCRDASRYAANEVFLEYHRNTIFAA